MSIYNISTGFYHHRAFAVCYGIVPAVMPILFEANPLAGHNLSFVVTLSVVIVTAVMCVKIYKKRERMEKRYRERLGRARLQLALAEEDQANLHPAVEHAKGVSLFIANSSVNVSRPL